VVAQVAVVLGRTVAGEAAMGFLGYAVVREGIGGSFRELVATVRCGPFGVVGHGLRRELAHRALERSAVARNSLLPQALLDGDGETTAVPHGFHGLAKEADGVPSAEDPSVGGLEAGLVHLDPAGRLLDAKGIHLVGVGRGNFAQALTGLRC